jgi:oligosaccharide 4-alpha-D-glucosyltransferase
VEAVVRLYRQDSIPLDAVVLDLYWFGPEIQGSLGNLDWLRDSFPEPEKMMANLDSQGIKTVLITEPFILDSSLTYPDAAARGLLGTNAQGAPFLYDFYFGHTALLDIFKPEAQQWFWDIYRKHSASGVAGWWGDLGEPEVHPDDMRHINGRADHVHNLYGHVWAKTLFEGYQRDFPDKRPLILMRAGFAGSQRYGMIPWTGDVKRSWGGLQPQVELGLSMGMQGLGYIHSDLGGFADDYRDSELYVRWLQYGVFQPVFRTHAQEIVPPEPVFWDEQTKAHARRAIQLRYRLLPYTYTLAFENHTKGWPLMRPLSYADDQPAHYTNADTYLWGGDFLVAPVTHKGAATQRVDFPSGSLWLDFYTGKAFEGGQQRSVPVVDSHIPVFVRAGAFIPMAEPLPHTAAYNPATTAVHFYHHDSVRQSTGIWYEDDGATPDAYQKGQYSLHTFQSTFEQGTLTIRRSTEGQPWPHPIALYIHGQVPETAYAETRTADGDKGTVRLERTERGVRVVLQPRETAVVIGF